MRLIANALNYADNDPAGLGGHQIHILVSRLYTLVEILMQGYREDELSLILEPFYDLCPPD